jgi:hypothetical protein
MLLVFTLPSNVLAVPPLAVLTVAAFRTPGTAVGRSDVTRFVQLGVASAILAALAYVPIILGQWLGISKLHNTKGDAVTDRLLAAKDEIALAVSQLAPRGMSVAAFGWLVLAVVVAAAACAWRPARRLTRIGLAVIAATLVIRVGFAAFVAYQTRVRTALVPALAIGMFLVVHDLTAAWSRRFQLVVSLALVIASLTLMPSVIGESVVYRVPSDIAAFLEMYARPEARNVLIVHENLEDPLLPVGRVFGRDHVVTSLSDFRARTGAGEDRRPRHAPGTWQRRLRDMVLPVDPFRPIDPAKVEVLVVIDDESKNSFASKWTDPALAGMKARLPRRSEFRRAEFRIQIFEG